MCHDSIDNDCDLMTDAVDPDCRGACVEDVQSTCPDGRIILVARCEEGVLNPTGERCAGIIAAPSGTCGDGMVQTPNAVFIDEDCEANSDCGSGGICITAASPPAIRAAGPQCSCYYECSVDPGDVFDLAVASKNGANNLTWAVGASARCTLDYFDIYRCSTDGDSCEPETIIHRDDSPADGASNKYDDTDVEFDMRYCYQIKAHYDELGAEVSSEVRCVSTGNEICAEREGRFCSDDRSQVLSCPTNEVTIFDTCSEGETCTDAPPGLARCVRQDACDQCNSLFRIFGVVPGIAELGRQMCETLTTCALDSSKTTVDQWQQCSQIGSCYDYASKDACETNRCSVPECEWALNPASIPGAGVCRPKEKELQECGKCAASPTDALRLDPKHNKIFNSCDRVSCPLYGDGCYFSDSECQHKSDLGCRAYGRDENACVTESNEKAIVNVQYSTYNGNIIRYNGDNAFTQRSADLFGYGTCVYGAAEGCFKDADSNNLPDCGGLAAYSRACEQDNMPPTTIIKKEGKQLEDGKLLLGRAIDLGLSLTESAKTYYCIASQDEPEDDRQLAAIASSLGTPAVGGPSPGAYTPADVLVERAPFRDVGACYPATGAPCSIQQILPEGAANRDAIIFYYSEDANKNLEPVRREPIFLDTIPPTITVTPMLTEDGLTVDMSSGEEVMCFAHLENEEGIEMRASPEAAVSHRIDGELDASFSRTFYSLPEDAYYWKYRCFDHAGNSRSGSVAIDIDRNAIHYPQPRGPLRTGGDITLSVDTDEPAECRYKEKSGLLPPVFDSMDAMTADADGLHHTASVFVGCSECYKVYDIKCRMTVSGEIQGGRDDRVRFAIDTQGPRVEAFTDMNASLPFDQSLTYGEAQTLFLRCMDDSIEQATGVRNFDFGCSNLTLSIPDLGDRLYNPSEDVPMGPIVVDSTSSLIYTALDNAGQESRGDIAVEIDESGPTLSTDIVDLASRTHHEAGDTLGPGGYTVRLRTNTLLKSAEASLDVDGTPMMDVSLTVYSEGLFERQFYMPLLGLPDGVYTARVRITGTQAMPGARCTLEGSEADVETTATIDFTIDTNVPEVTLEPLLDNITEEDGISDFRDYSVYKYGRTYYTNQESLYLTGFLDNQSKAEDVRFYAGQEDADLETPVATYSIAENNAEDWEGMLHGFTLNRDASAGSNALVLNAPPGGVFAGKYLYLGHDRVAYGHYHDFYKVRSVAGSTVTLTEPVEQDVPAGFSPQVFERPHPMDWFGGNVSLALGLNRVIVSGRSPSGVEAPAPMAEVVLDVYPPEIVASSPRPGSRSQPVTSISFRVREAEGTAMLDEDSVSLRINGEEAPITITSEDAGMYVVYNITHILPEQLLNGTYDVQLTGRDRAGNAFTEAGGTGLFTFTIDDGLPSPPEWTIKEATRHDNIWYVDHSPDFIIDFSDNDLPVIISGVFLQYHGTASQYEIRVDCAQPSPNVFDCHPETPIRMNRAYDLIVEAHKQYPEAAGRTGSFVSEQVVLDNIRPNMVFVLYRDPTAERVPLNIQAAIPNERFPLRAKWNYLGDDVIYDLNLTGNDRRGNYVFTWQVPDYSIADHANVMNPNVVILSVTDYANNGPALWNGTIRIDLTPPELEGFTFTPQVEYADPDAHEYYTKRTIINITGTFRDSDIAAISVTPGNWMPGRSAWQPIAFANLRPDNTYSMQLVIKGEFNNTIESNYTLAIEDRAGNRVSIPYWMYADLKPPERPDITFS